MAETQNETSRSSFLDEIVPQLRSLSRWEKLQILDLLLELCANPILWLRHAEGAAPEMCPQISSRVSNTDQLVIKNPTVRSMPLPSFIEGKLEGEIEGELKQNLVEIEHLLSPTGVSLNEVLEQFRIQVGPRVDPFRKNRELRGLALSDYHFVP